MLFYQKLLILSQNVNFKLIYFYQNLMMNNFKNFILFIYFLAKYATRLCFYSFLLFLCLGFCSAGFVGIGVRGFRRILSFVKVCPDGFNCSGESFELAFIIFGFLVRMNVDIVVLFLAFGG